MKKLLLQSILSILVLMAASLAHAQNGVVRIEFPAELDKDPYEVVPLEGEGVLVFYAQAEMMSEGDRSWHLIAYDTSLLVKWETNIPVLDGARYRHSFTENGKLYLFFLNPGKIKTGNDNYQISELDLTSGIINHYKGLIPDIYETRGLLVMGDKVVLACDMNNEQVGVFFIDISRQSVKTYFSDLPDQNFIEDFQVNPYSGTVMLVISNFMSRKQNRLVIANLDVEARTLSSYPIEVVLPSKFLNSAKIYAIGAGNQMVVGTYSNFASKIPGENDYYGLESAGFFATRFENGEQQFMNYYNFMELQNLRPAISARDYLKLAKKKNRDESEYSADYEVLLHPLTRDEDRYLIMAESFYPDFRTVSDISYDYWGRPVTHTYTVFEGYQIFQSILMAFDQDGILLWDNSLDLKNIRTEELTTRTGFLIDGKPSILYYNDGIRISYRVFAQNAQVEDVISTELDTSHTGDKVVDLGDNYMVPWYGSDFLCFGYETIKNNLLEKDKRTVFYLNKITFE